MNEKMSELIQRINECMNEWTITNKTNERMDNTSSPFSLTASLPLYVLEIYWSNEQAGCKTKSKSSNMDGGIFG